MTKTYRISMEIANHFDFDEVREGGEVGRALQLGKEQKFMNILGKSWFGKNCWIGNSLFGIKLVWEKVCLCKSWFGKE